MGDRGTKKTNKMLETQTNKANTYADKMGGHGDEERQFQTGLRGDILGKYNDLYDSFGDGSGGSGGGGGGGGYTPQAWGGLTPLATTSVNYADPRMNEAMQGFRDLSQTGGFNTEQMQDFRGRATATLPAFYQSLQDKMESANRAAGGNVGFNSQMAKLAREQAYGANRVSQEAEADLQDRIRAGKERGLEGVGRYDTEFMNRGSEIEKLRNEEQLRQNQDVRSEQLRQQAAQDAWNQQQQSMAAAAANRNSANAEQQFRNRMAILEAERGLRGEQGTDLPYYNQELAGINSGTNAVANRVPETSTWDTIGSGILGAGTAIAEHYLPPKKR